MRRQRRMRASRIPERVIPDGIEIPLDDDFVTLERKMKKMFGRKGGQEFMTYVWEELAKHEEEEKDKESSESD